MTFTHAVQGGQKGGSYHEFTAEQYTWNNAYRPNPLQGGGLRGWVLSDKGGGTFILITSGRIF